MQKRALIVLFMLIFSLAIVSAEKLDIIPLKETFVAGENINFKVSLYDSDNNPIEGNVSVTIEDAEKRVQIEKTVPANKVADVNLGEGAPAGYWKITGEFNDVTSSSIFMVELNEVIKFELKNSTLTIINTGNIKYSKAVQVVIGDSISTKQVDLDVGERLSFRLVAPEGTYNIKVTDGKVTFTKSDVALTGKVVGVLDNRDTTTSPLTSGIKGEESPYGDEPAPSKNSSFIFVFLLVLIGAAVLLTIERRFKKAAFSSE